MKRISLCVLSLILALSLTPAFAVEPTDDIKISDWAMADVTRADVLGLLSDRLEGDYTKPITRIQFAELAVNLVERVTGNTIEIQDTVVFTDTTDSVAIKSASAGIVQGTGDGTTFSPNRQITREELVTMAYRAILYIDKSNLISDTGLSSFSDAKDVSTWAEESMRALVGSGIIKGTSTTELSPQSDTSIEQAILIIYRIYSLILNDIAQTPAQQYAEAQQLVQEQLQESYSGAEGDTSAAEFYDSRVNTVNLAEVYVVDGKRYLIFTMTYSLKASNPDDVLLVGSLEMDSEGWVTDTQPTSLVLTESSGELELVGGFMTEFTPDGNTQMFKSDFEQWLEEVSQ